MARQFFSSRLLRVYGVCMIPLPEGWEYRISDPSVIQMWTMHPNGSVRREVTIRHYDFDEPWEPTLANAKALMREQITENVGWEHDTGLLRISDNEGWPVVGYLYHQTPEDPHEGGGITGHNILWLIHIITGRWGFVLMEFAINDPKEAHEAQEQAAALADNLRWASDAEREDAIREKQEGKDRGG